MDDMPGLGRPQQDDDQLRHTLTVHEVSEQLATAGVPRSERQIKRYCETGFLDAKKIPGPTGEQWFIAPAALPRLIGDLQQWQMQRAGHVRPGPATTSNDRPENPDPFGTDTPGQGRPQQATSDTEPEGKPVSRQMVTAGHVTQLEKRIEDKDKQIDFLQEELTDRRDQIRGMKDIISEQKLLLESMNNNIAPIFKALAASVEKGTLTPAPEPIRATIVEQPRDLGVDNSVGSPQSAL